MRNCNDGLAFKNVFELTIDSILYYNICDYVGGASFRQSNRSHPQRHRQGQKVAVGQD